MNKPRCNARELYLDPGHIGTDEDNVEVKKVDEM
jgi:hypothetical protein